MKHVSLGGLDDDESIRAIHRALDLGGTHIDTAEIYGPFHSEGIVGQAIKGRRGAGGERTRPRSRTHDHQAHVTWPPESGTRIANTSKVRKGNHGE